MSLLLYFLGALLIKMACTLTVGQVPGLLTREGNNLASLPILHIPRVSGLSGLKFDPLSLKDAAEFTEGWGLFNLGAEVDDVIFTLQNHGNNYVPHVLKPSDLRTFSDSAWDQSQKTIIVIHGYTEDGNNSPLSATKKIITAYANAGRLENLIFVDWHDLARQFNYFRSANNTEKVGLYVAELIIFLRNSKYMSSLKDVHVVGFSLGAHVAGIASYYAGHFLEEQVGRVTGLDPAGPGFSGPSVSLESRLDPGDGAFVDVMHTNMGSILTTFGTVIQSGHADHYPNGGEHQPGCTLRLVGEPVGVCSHLKAPEYFSKTIEGAVYLGYPCGDYDTFLRGSCSTDRDSGVKMGEFIDPTARGKYYLTIPLGD